MIHEAFICLFQYFSLYEDKDGLSDNLKTTIDERDAYLRDLHAEKNKNLDNLYIPQLKEVGALLSVCSVIKLSLPYGYVTITCIALVTAE